MPWESVGNPSFPPREFVFCFFLLCSIPLTLGKGLPFPSHLFLKVSRPLFFVCVPYVLHKRHKLSTFV